MLDYLMYASSIIYLPFVYYSNYVNTKNRDIIKKSDLIENLYVLWNIFLTIFSIWGTLNTIPYIYNKFQNDKLLLTVTDNDLWIYCYYPLKYFAASKILELGDTVFLFLRGKQIRFIQYYHHLVTMLYCWHAHYRIEGGMNINLLFCSMNYFIHSIMYLWYTLSSLNYKTSSIVKNSITFLQNIQMVLGLYFIYIAQNFGKWYQYDFYGSIYATFMYFSYVLLFGYFLLNLKLKLG